MNQLWPDSFIFFTTPQPPQTHTQKPFTVQFLFTHKCSGWGLLSIILSHLQKEISWTRPDSGYYKCDRPNFGQEIWYNEQRKKKKEPKKQTNKQRILSYFDIMVQERCILSIQENENHMLHLLPKEFHWTFCTGKLTFSSQRNENSDFLLVEAKLNIYIRRVTKIESLIEHSQLIVLIWRLFCFIRWCTRTLQIQKCHLG